MRQRTVLSLTTALCITTIAYAAFAQDQQEGPRITELTVNGSGSGDLASLLQVREITGSYTLSEGVKSVGLRLAFYKNGELVASDRTISLKDVETSAEGTFAVHIADLDYLPLGKYEPDQHLIQTHLSIPNGFGGSSKDAFPKSTFSITRAFSSKAFHPEGGNPNKAPLFYIIGDGEGPARGANTPQQAVRRNSERDVLIAYLEFE